MTGPDFDDRPDEHDEIRRLLADARHTEPMPADVAARMDAVLADLSSSRPAGDVRVETPTAAVISLSAHRRRRAGGLLVAAAAIVIAGIAVTQHLPTQAGNSSAAASATDRGADAAANGEAQPSSPSPQNLSSAGAGAPKLAKGRVVVHARTFPADATAAQRLAERSYAADRTASPTPVTPACVAAPVGSHTVPATFRRALAALVFLRPEGDTQVVDLYLCGQPQPIRSVTLPAP